MKKLLLLILAATLLLGGCYKEDPVENPVVFYYIPQEPMVESDFHHDMSYIRSETRDGTNLGTSLPEILTAYLQGPSADSALRSPFPTGTKLYNVNLTQETLYITMDGSFAELTDLDLTIACVCLTRTCMELTDAQTVQIAAKGALLDGAEYIRLDASSVELTDSYTDESE